MLVFLIVAIYLRQGKKCWGRQVAALAGPAPGAPAVFEFCCKHLLPGPGGVAEGEACGEPSLQFATVLGWQIDLDIADSWQQLEQSWDVTPRLRLAPGPRQLW